MINRRQEALLGASLLSRHTNGTVCRSQLNTSGVVMIMKKKERDISDVTGNTKMKSNFSISHVGIYEFPHSSDKICSIFKSDF